MLRYKDFTLIIPNKIQSKRIADIIEKYDGSIFHEVELNKIVERQFNTQLFYFVDDPNDINILSPVHIKRNRLGVRRYNFKPLGDIPYAGFVGKQSIDVDKFTIGFFESIKYEGFPFSGGLDNDFTSTRFGETSMVDLSLDDDEIFNRIIQPKRRNIKKAIKAGISIKRYFTIDGLNMFWPILEELHKNLGFTRFSFNYYSRFFKKYASKNKSFILIAFKEEIPISGVFIIGNKNYMHYYKGATLFNVKKEGQGELLHWEAIKLSKDLGSKYYDLCNLNKEKYPGIYRFKTGISNDIYKYPIYSKNKLGFKIVNRFSKFE